MKSCGKYGKWFFSILLCIFLAPCATAAGPEGSAVSYEETVAQWKSYHDVAHWLAGSFGYDKSKLLSKRQIPQSPTETFRLKKGVCYDAANFTIDALNRINPGYKAKAVFIKNRLG
ncbi:MAG: transglutaminase-like domain-containing protein, partial [Syntrophales bacterium]